MRAAAFGVALAAVFGSPGASLEHEAEGYVYPQHSLAHPYQDALNHWDMVGSTIVGDKASTPDAICNARKKGTASHHHSQDCYTSPRCAKRGVLSYHLIPYWSGRTITLSY